MKARMNVGGNRMRERVIKFQRRAEKDGERRVAQRLHGIRLNLGGRTSGEIASILNVHRSNASLWLKHWQQQFQFRINSGLGRSSVSPY